MYKSHTIIRVKYLIYRVYVFYIKKKKKKIYPLTILPRYSLSASANRFWNIVHSILHLSLTPCHGAFPFSDFPWLPSDGITLCIIHCESTTPIFSWAGCKKQKHTNFHHQSREYIWLWSRRPTTTYFNASSKRKVETPSMNQIVLHQKDKKINQVLTLFHSLIIIWKTKTRTSSLYLQIDKPESYATHIAMLLEKIQAPLFQQICGRGKNSENSVLTMTKYTLEWV